MLLENNNVALHQCKQLYNKLNQILPRGYLTFWAQLFKSWIILSTELSLAIKWITQLFSPIILVRCIRLDSAIRRMNNRGLLMKKLIAVWQHLALNLSLQLSIRETCTDCRNYGQWLKMHVCGI